MHVSKNLIPRKREYLLASIIFLLISLTCLAFSKDSHDDFNISRREVLLRRIGHELLLQSGDSKSRVLPVKKISENEYQISFENDLIFLPDSLVGTTRRLLSRDPLTSDYVVNVLNAETSDVTYGYAISKNKKEEIIACRGRTQPRASYKINIRFIPTGMSAATKGYLLGGLPFLALTGFIFLRSAKPRKTLPEGKRPDLLTLGTEQFDRKSRKLTIKGETIDLTSTETRILYILALSPNEVIERNRLQKEIWEDEGVIVGRSLDMFISKLRKKLEPNPEVRIVAVRGKGYRLEVDH